MNVLDSSTSVEGCVGNTDPEQEILTGEKIRSTSLEPDGMSHVNGAPHSDYNLDKQIE